MFRFNDTNKIDSDLSSHPNATISINSSLSDHFQLDTVTKISLPLDMDIRNTTRLYTLYSWTGWRFHAPEQGSFLPLPSARTPIEPDAHCSSTSMYCTLPFNMEPTLNITASHLTHIKAYASLTSNCVWSYAYIFAKLIFNILNWI